MSRPNTSKTSQEQRQAPDVSSALSEQPSLAGSWDALLALQIAAGNQAVGQLLRDGAAGSGSDGAGRNDGSGAGGARAPALIQRKPANGHDGGQTERQTEQQAEKSARPLIAEDDVERLQPGQMRKSEFLEQLHSSVCGAAEEALAGTMWSAMGCPYIDRWFSHYSGQSSQHIESALRKYAPEAAGAGSARDYITIVTLRLRRGIGQWKETGEMTDVPEELAQGGMPGVTAAGLMGGLVGGALSAVGGAVSGLVSGVGRALSGLGRMLFKGRDGGAREVSDPEAIRGRMGAGQSLDGKTQARMERAFGADFSGVKVHTDSRASVLSDDLNARAFTIGKDVAFGSGEYKPGTVVGDALIAHELAHVVQQNGNGSALAPLHKGGTDYDALESDADEAAVGAVVSVWGGAVGKVPDIGRNAAPRLKSGLKLQGCKAKKSSPQVDVSQLPEGRIREAAAELSQSDEIVDRNTSRQLAEGNIHAYYIEDLSKPDNVDDKLRGYGLDPSIYTIYLHPVSGEEMIEQKNYLGFAHGRRDIFGLRSLSLSRWKELLVHETSHAVNPPFSTALERYQSEFRAYWVAEFRNISDLDERARLIRDHVLSDYPNIKSAYDSDPAVKAAIDSYTRPEGDMTNLGTLTPEGGAPAGK